MIKYADDCLAFASNKDEKIAKKSLESNKHNLANYSRDHQLNMNSSKKGLICLKKKGLNKTKHRPNY